MQPTSHPAAGDAVAGSKRDPSAPASRFVPFVRAALAGAVAAAVAVGVGHLVSVLTGPATSPILTVGAVLIDAAPQELKAFAIETFGSSDKVALLTGVLLGVVAAGTLVGLVAARWRLAGVAGVVGFGAVAVGAAISRPGAPPAAALPAAVAAAAALGALMLLLRIGRSGHRAAGSAPEGAPTGPDRAQPFPRADASRRRFLLASLAVGAVGAAAGGLGVVLSPRTRAGGEALAAIPSPDDPAPSIDPATSLEVDGVPPFFTPNDAFYRVDIALVPPAVDVSAWRLRVHGMVDRELSLTFGDLVDLPLVERDITLACVSNPVGGPYVGNARWLGVPLRAVLDEAGIQDAAEQLVSRAPDGMTIGTPVGVALDGRDALLAIAMNGQPLSPEHGAPARMIVPGLFGYVSATKWLTEIEAARWDAYDPYWVQRGWVREAPIRTMSRIDTPRPLATLPAARVRVGGVAWAPHRGVDRVEVRVDDGPWMEARLSAVDTIDTWRQWTWDWPAATGRHSISVRATDGTGAVQPQERMDPFPSGATGWHTVVVTVS